MTTVTLYMIERFMSEGSACYDCWYSLLPWGGDTASSAGWDDGGKDYVLPDGFRVAMSNGDDLCIYDADNDHCVLGGGSRTKYPFVGNLNHYHVLRPLGISA